MAEQTKQSTKGNIKQTIFDIVFWAAFLLALLASISHVAGTFNSLERPGSEWVGWTAAIAIDCGLAALAYAIQQRRKAGRNSLVLWVGVVAFAFISGVANWLHALSVDPTADWKALLFSGTLPLLVVYLGEIVSSDDVAKVKQAEHDAERAKAKEERDERRAKLELEQMEARRAREIADQAKQAELEAKAKQAEHRAEQNRAAREQAKAKQIERRAEQSKAKAEQKQAEASQKQGDASTEQGEAIAVTGQFPCPFPGCGYDEATSQKALNGHMLKHSPRWANRPPPAHPVQPEVSEVT